MMFFQTKICVLLVCCFVIGTMASPQLLGGIKPLSGDELKTAQEDLDKSLTKLAAGDGPVYKISKVNSATLQIVSGSLTKLNVDLIDSHDVVKTGDVSIWAQPWLPNGIEVSFEFPGEEKIVKKHSA